MKPGPTNCCRGHISSKPISCQRAGSRELDLPLSAADYTDQSDTSRLEWRQIVVLGDYHLLSSPMDEVRGTRILISLVLTDN